MGAFVAVVVLLAVIGASTALAVFLRRKNKQLASGGAGIDPFTVGEPWRRHVAAAQAAQRRYRAHVQTLAAGPLRARMAEIGMQVDRGVADCWEIARRGHQLDATIRTLNPSDLQARLERAGGTREEASLRAQIGSVDRIRAARDDAEARLRTLQTRLGELVASSAEITVGTDAASAWVDTADAGTTGELGNAVDDVVTQLEALRLAIREVNEPLAGLEGGTGAPG